MLTIEKEIFNRAKKLQLQDEARMFPWVVRKMRGDYDVYIGRGSKWGNPFVIGPGHNREDVVRSYICYILNNKKLLKALPLLYNKSLGCFCAPLLCHGHVLRALLELRSKLCC